jgi:hypothetical protein
MRPSPCKTADFFVRNSLTELNERVTVVKSRFTSNPGHLCNRLIVKNIAFQLDL